MEFDEKSARIYKNPNNDPKGRWRAASNDSSRIQAKSNVSYYKSEMGVYIIRLVEDAGVQLNQNIKNCSMQVEFILEKMVILSLAL